MHDTLGIPIVPGNPEQMLLSVKMDSCDELTMGMQQAQVHAGLSLWTSACLQMLGQNGAGKAEST